MIAEEILLNIAHSETLFVKHAEIVKNNDKLSTMGCLQNFSFFYKIVERNDLYITVHILVK